MSIYTRTGDSGTTSLFGGKRISKADCQVETYGSIDELTSFIGLTGTKIKNKKDKQLLIEIQKDLYQIMGFLSGAKVDLLVLEKKVTEFEKTIDLIEEKLPKLNKFILPGGNEISALFQILRVICRKAERVMVNYYENNLTMKQLNNVLIYLNRLSDLFFILARKYGKKNEVVL
ncbi:ATP:cob(I)alamin adenosyltransferase [Candidatus Roizmanbacteria bacterium CG_4_9_14_3_um_filter_33_18]|uniref:Corrinoid adenosyltransferase n=3 Tax=Candidatus Roizmaniibacteriota TaxID=1752723 RepID=A0A2M7UAF7_9BACT|nr:MAG: ATP:cob(I)alamin adenosyltransferase [Candidatus Roizmanbacteria bacterium CG22_combo_CG10-13_8_21_14_all_34_12]PIZ68169.1 MAG: ATP:cob(I)alamin adenosyltransferase [Candidatus Roizmanbacteria bacterium CG_4_10_14_0_2_um_filter_33_96]PJA55707.1 MAG: ATP:cob(I)alamin adenosyltransferase [Candidatus Roizmanbacteria bacterium CG_4_9_14_3_um_filter_33_18]